MVFELINLILSSLVGIFIFILASHIADLIKGKTRTPLNSDLKFIMIFFVFLWGIFLIHTSIEDFKDIVLTHIQSLHP